MKMSGWEVFKNIAGWIVAVIVVVPLAVMCTYWFYKFLFGLLGAIFGFIFG